MSTTVEEITHKLRLGYGRPKRIKDEPTVLLEAADLIDSLQQRNRELEAKVDLFAEHGSELKVCLDNWGEIILTATGGGVLCDVDRLNHIMASLLHQIANHSGGSKNDL